MFTTALAIQDAITSKLANASRSSRMSIFFTSGSIQLLMFSSGIYVPDDDRWPEKFRGIGIRIEDSVCVGDDSPIVLSPEAVKEV